ncbi:Nramp family divalent metal transporter [Cellulosilyticum sp. I15G10I2]|uniref:Nramp family divalent metal transporter n=1 Tax=Cellulosilyticum sp. I15G10I2 TaxID=1892843 RepID=UPI00085C14AF|nr:Nramp family divalent metal transporter [Cellulosilyticum sp. I15G10I2]
MNKFLEKMKNIGPGALVAAAFIGPGTVTTCTVSGASFGYSLLWAMLFSTLATIILQEMSGRLGIVTQQGLGECIREKFTHPALKWFVVILIISAILIGNIAYETGNIVGGAMGLGTVLPQVSTQVWGPLLGIIAFFLLWSGNYKKLEKFFIGLVIIMSVVFISTAIVIRPDFGAILKGLFVPTMPATDKAWLTVVGLIGTTVVPYNLFLHASSVSKKWNNVEEVKVSRMDTIISIGLGGIISMAIIITASAAFYGSGQEIKSAGQMATQLEPVLGSWAKWFFGIGIFSAGFTSTITAPLAAAFATAGILGWGSDLKDKRFKGVWIVVLLTGILLSALGQTSPVQVILFAQAANAIILPIIAIFLTVVLNDNKLMGKYKNTLVTNILACIVIGITILISIRSFTLFFAQLKNLLGL